MSDTVERLRASKIQADERRYRDGCEAGKAWASTTAEADQLERLDAHRDACGGTEGCLSGEPMAPLDHAGWIAAAILFEDEDDRDTAEAGRFADELFGARRSDAYLRGFIDGALETWDEVGPQL